MKKRDNIDKENLAKSQTRRINALMISCLSKFEELFADIEDSSDGRRFKNHLKNVFNDSMRAGRDELNDYDVEYRPMRFNRDNVLSLTRSIMQSNKSISFSFLKNNDPCMIISLDNKKILEAMRSEFDCGVTYEDSVLNLVIVGVQDCVNRVIPIMDKYRLSEGVRVSYRDWRSKVIKLYRKEQ